MPVRCGAAHCTCPYIFRQDLTINSLSGVDSDDLQATTLMDDDMVVVVRESHPLLVRRRPRLADLEGAHWLLPRAGVSVRRSIEGRLAEASAAGSARRACRSLAAGHSATGRYSRTTCSWCSVSPAFSHARTRLAWPSSSAAHQPARRAGAPLAAGATCTCASSPSRASVSRSADGCGTGSVTPARRGRGHSHAATACRCKAGPRRAPARAGARFLRE